MDKPLVWMDLEMSGLDPNQHVILEIASVVTDQDLNVILECPTLAIHYPEHVLAEMNGWSREHHRVSGLLERVRMSTLDCRTAEEQTLLAISECCEKGQSPLCGNTIWQDRRFLLHHMPRLEAYFHYRNVDVSSLKELVRRWYPDLPEFQKQKTHLAMNDIKESLEELRYYRDNIFVKPGALRLP
jgi:oligoribonuclease